MLQLLSYPYNAQTVGWVGNLTYQLSPQKEIGAESYANTCHLTLHNHSGTHFDAPRHFSAHGPTIDQLPLDRFVFTKPLLLDIPKDPDVLLVVSDLAPYLAQIQAADLLLLRTGISRYRHTDPLTYQQHGSGFHGDLGAFLMEYCPNLKAIGLDCISLSAYQHHAQGIAAHQAMLGTHRSDGRYICIIEDMNLADVDGEKLCQVTASPLLVAEMDSAPVTVIAHSAP